MMANKWLQPQKLVFYTPARFLIQITVCVSKSELYLKREWLGNTSKYLVQWHFQNANMCYDIVIFGLRSMR